MWPGGTQTPERKQRRSALRKAADPQEPPRSPLPVTPNGLRGPRGHSWLWTGLRIKRGGITSPQLLCSSSGNFIHFQSTGLRLQFSKKKERKESESEVAQSCLTATPWTAAHQAPPSMGFSRQECWSGCHNSQRLYLMWKMCVCVGVRMVAGGWFYRRGKNVKVSSLEWASPRSLPSRAGVRGSPWSVRNGRQSRR